jgi:hypothetical protein
MTPILTEAGLNPNGLTNLSVPCHKGKLPQEEMRPGLSLLPGHLTTEADLLEAIHAAPPAVRVDPEETLDRALSLFI